jgi:phosphoribosylformylglycinamidine (FGAM) synthase PurS component
VAARHSFFLSVELKATGNEARSALEALQEKMGLREHVRDLAREDLWEIEVDARTAAGARETIEQLVRTTNLFANPNKHKYTLADAGGAEPGRDRGERGSHGPGRGSDGAASWAAGLEDDEVAVLVTDRESAEGESVLSAIRRIGVDDVVSIRRWTRWRIRLAEPPTRGDPEVLALIRRIGVATGRRDGLLSNPHSQISRAILPWGEEKVLAA